MDEQPGLSEQYRMASPWPMFVALGIPIAEIGILFGLLPIAVGGLLLFCGSVAGILQEAGYVRTPWPALVVMAVILGVVGSVFVFTDVSLPARGYAILVAAGMLFVGAVVGSVVASQDSTPL
ncbi:MAG: DUF7541 family protein [Halobacteriota archaeon]